MKQVFFLVDYDNQREGRFRGMQPGGVSLNFRDHEDFLVELVRKLVSFRQTDLAETKELLELRVRLYGGWTDLEGQTTNLADMVLKAIRQQGRSQRTGVTRVLVDLGDRPLAGNSETLVGTHRPIPWRGILRASRQRPEGCTSAHSTCAHIDSALSWGGGRCPSHPACPVKRDDAFEFEGQKMVDTMMVADAIYAHLAGALDVITCSADDDVIPGLLTLVALRGRATLMRFGMRKRGRFDAMLERSRIRVIDYPAIA